jgi:hypothetical protein
MALCEEADFGVLHYQYTTKFDAMTRPEISLPIFIYNPDLILRNKFSPAKHLQAFP